MGTLNAIGYLKIKEKIQKKNFFFFSKRENRRRRKEEEREDRVSL